MLLDLLYRLSRPLLFRLDPERAHELTLSLAARAPRLLGALAGGGPRPAPRELCGLTISSPVGLAAGLDKNAVALPLWERLGFGFVEVGTVTPRPQAGNPRPRVFRLPAAHALINAMGFPNEGAEAIGLRLEALRARGRWPRVPVGINLGKNKDTPAEDAPRDYEAAARRLVALADYLVVNVSSPNTPGLRALQQAGELRRILEAVGAVANGKPVLVKLAPDLEDEPLVEAVEVAHAAGAAGLIATNTTLTRPVPDPAGHTGGFSGRPLFPLARGRIEVVLRAAQGLPVIGVGGVDSAERARELLELGCAAVQVYTGLIYEGPGLARRINRALARGA
ncbi:MAG: quinone-dependent dihydroorotate dehydrogenase [Planctomycetota bacterium]